MGLRGSRPPASGGQSPRGRSTSHHRGERREPKPISTNLTNARSRTRHERHLTPGCLSSGMPVCMDRGSDGYALDRRRPRPQYAARVATVSERIGAGRFVSFELWSPRSAESASALEAALGELAGLGPAFVAITYGAGGSTRERTHELVVRLVDSPMLPLAHLTCAAHGRAELVDLMERYRRAGVDNLLALQGDPPLSATDQLPEGDLRYAVELVQLARDLGFPGVGVALHPEGHPAATSREADWKHQAAKLREADFGLTQFFHRADDYFALVEEMRARGADAPVLPGVMPITNVRQVERMAAMSGTSIPDELGEKLLAVADRPDVVRQVGVEHATLLCRRLLDGGAPGLHFFTMNRAAATVEVCANLGWESAAVR